MNFYTNNGGWYATNTNTPMLWSTSPQWLELNATPAPSGPESNVDWLRRRVHETCVEAFA